MKKRVAAAVKVFLKSVGSTARDFLGAVVGCFFKKKAHRWV